jgi:Mrp family chromosome partitioning ATPase
MRLSTETLPARPAEVRPFVGQGVTTMDDTGGFVTDRALAGQLRELLTTLSHGQAIQRTPQRIVVTGVHTETEASFLATSLAMTCAGSGYRVLLVDANFERPMVHRNLGLSNKLGVSTLLSSADPPHTLPQATAFPNLAAITIGPPCPNLSSLLTREQLFHRLQPLAGSFDYMIVDCGGLAPALVARISGGADNVLIAVKEHVSSMKELSNIVETLRGEGVREPAVLMVE